MADVIVVGSFVQDLAFQTETYPALGETRIGRFTTGPGGKGFNQAVASARMDIATAFIGAVGSDIFGNGAQTFAKAEGIQSSFECVENIPSGAASVVIDKKAQNAIVVALGANEVLSPGFVERELGREAGAKILVVQAECSLAATRRALEIGKELGFINIFNPAPINPGVTEELLALTDVLVPNETEFTFLLQEALKIYGAIDPLTMADEQLHGVCRLFDVPTVVVTLGANGCFVSHRENPRPDWSRRDESAFYRAPSTPVDAVDTTGAGDAFIGGLAAGIIRSPQLFAEAVRTANMVAGLSVQKFGTAPAMPHRKEVDALLAK